MDKQKKDTMGTPAIKSTIENPVKPPTQRAEPKGFSAFKPMGARPWTPTSYYST